MDRERDLSPETVYREGLRSLDRRMRRLQEAYGPTILKLKEIREELAAVANEQTNLAAAEGLKKKAKDREDYLQRLKEGNLFAEFESQSKSPSISRTAEQQLVFFLDAYLHIPHEIHVLVSQVNSVLEAKEQENLEDLMQETLREIESKVDQFKKFLKEVAIQV